MCGDPAGTNPGRNGTRIETHRVRVVLTSLFVDLWAAMTTTEPMIRSLVTQMAVAGAASGPAAFIIELGKPAVGKPSYSIWTSFDAEQWTRRIGNSSS